MVVYLDQCAISELALNKNSDPRKDRLRELLQRGHSAGKVVCPLAAETALETMAVEDRRDRIKIYDLQSELASPLLGDDSVHAFRSIYRLLELETLAIARATHPPSGYHRVKWHSVSDDKLAQRQTAERLALNEVMRTRHEGTAKPRLAPMDSDLHAFFDLMDEHVGHGILQIDRLLAGEPPDPDLYLSHHWAKFLISNGINRDELQLLKAKMLREWRSIPVLFTHSLLAAQLTIGYAGTPPRKFNANTDIDVRRMAVALCSSDVIVTERGMLPIIEGGNKTRKKLHLRTGVEPLILPEIFAMNNLEGAADYIETALV